VADVCGTCHVVMENLYNKSPHKAAFAAMNLGGCVVCHGNHAVLRSSSKMLAGPESVCSQCHEPPRPEGSRGADGRSDRKLTAALERSDAQLRLASQSGMEVSEALLRGNDARGLWSKRVSPCTPSSSVPCPNRRRRASRSRRDLSSRPGRHAGAGTPAPRPGVSLITIVVTMAALWRAIRRLEKKAGRREG